MQQVRYQEAVGHCFYHGVGVGCHNVNICFRAEATKIICCLTVLKDYAGECDEEYAEERAFPAHERYNTSYCFVTTVIEV